MTDWEPPAKARPFREWNESDGDALWWVFPITEPPYVGSPLTCGHVVEVAVRAHGVDKMIRCMVGGWPGYHTHWTPLQIPADPRYQDRAREMTIAESLGAKDENEAIGRLIRWAAGLRYGFFIRQKATNFEWETGWGEKASAGTVRADSTSRPPRAQ